MTVASALVPAQELVKKSKVRFPNESEEYRRAREALLAEEIELRRHLERVAEQRRMLPPGGEVPKNYRFYSESGPKLFEELFGDKDTLVIYSYMFGPQRPEPCPMCTSLLSALDGEIPDIQQQVSFAAIARSPIERLVAFKKERRWNHLPLVSDLDGDFSRDYHGLGHDGGDMPALNVFTRRDGKIRHFWSEEMSFDTADPGQDPRGAPDLMPIWNLLDVTPAGRPAEWYPELRY
jgi:predicted dithiol-disulfide oxidoreductase (DUF899 family)